VSVGASDDKKKQFRFAHHAYRDRALIQHAIILRIYDIEHGTAEIRYQQLTDAVWRDLTMDHAEYVKPTAKAVRKRYADLTKGVAEVASGDDDDMRHGKEALSDLKLEIQNIKDKQQESKEKQEEERNQKETQIQRQLQAAMTTSSRRRKMESEDEEDADNEEWEEDTVIDERDNAIIPTPRVKPMEKKRKMTIAVENQYKNQKIMERMSDNNMRLSTKLDALIDATHQMMQNRDRVETDRHEELIANIRGQPRNLIYGPNGYDNVENYDCKINLY